MARVLVIEDNPVNMKLAALLLGNAGYTVLSAVDAETGLLVARADLPDLILMDIQLPGMDGLVATALLKQDPVTALIPVIAVTAMVTLADKEKSLMAGCAAYIAKPLRYLDLYAAIDSVLGKSQVSRAIETSRPGFAAIPGWRGRSAPQHVAAECLDLKILEGLVGNDPAVVLEFLGVFRLNANRIALDLETSCADGQAQQAAGQAHKLKSSAHIIGAVPLAELCAKLETTGKEGGISSVDALMPAFRRELDAVNVHIEALHVSLADHG
jgi:two-component system cell cycle response regulator DivK